MKIAVLVLASALAAGAAWAQLSSPLPQGSGAIGLLGLCTPAPLPEGRGEESCAQAAPAARAEARTRAAIFMACSGSKGVLCDGPVNGAAAVARRPPGRH